MSLYKLGQQIGDTLGLRILNAAGDQITINTPAWQQTFRTALQAIQSDTLYYYKVHGKEQPLKKFEDYLLDEPFTGGRMAMTIDNADAIDIFNPAMKALKGKVRFDWDVVTIPVDPARPDYTTAISFPKIFAINAKSGNAKAAWKFIQYFHSEEFARASSKINFAKELSTRSGYFKDDAGRYLDAFYALKPAAPENRHTISWLLIFPGNLINSQRDAGASINRWHPLGERISQPSTEGPAIIDDSRTQHSDEITFKKSILLPNCRGTFFMLPAHQYLQKL